MPKAKRASSTLRGQNVIELRPTSSMTSADLTQARREMHRLPSSWFELSFTRNMDLDGPRHYLTLERVGGAPVGWFIIARHERGFIVEAMGELGDNGGEGPIVQADTIAEAVQVVRDLVDAQLAGWSVQLAA